MRTRARISDLYEIEGKAELVGGEIVYMSPTGRVPGRASGDIYMSLRQYERQHGHGYAFPDNVGFVVSLPHRESFSPDAAWHTGALQGGKFLDGAPVFAAEIRSENDYGPAAEEKMREKRTDYFASGTLVVWDVDVLRDRLIRVYRASAPYAPTIYRQGDVAEAEPAVPGWRFAVDELFG